MIAMAGSILLLKLVMMGGLALWCTLAVINNVVAGASGVAAVGRTMSMALLEAPPAIDTPLANRAVIARECHRLSFAVLVALQSLAAVLCWCAAGAYVLALGGALAPTAAVTWANWALAAFALMAWLLHLGGLWFAYWIRQEGLQTTHIALLILGCVLALIVNTE